MDTGPFVPDPLLIAMGVISPVYAFLQDRFANPAPLTGGDIYEYRLLLSGCAFNADLEGDYTKSSLGGLLLEEPFPLWKVGPSYDEYPQELAAWIKVAPVTYENEHMSAIGSPHEIVAGDLAALLTLVFRRLVVVIGPASVTLPAPYDRPPIRTPLGASFEPRLQVVVDRLASERPDYRNRFACDPIVLRNAVVRATENLNHNNHEY